MPGSPNHTGCIQAIQVLHTWTERSLSHIQPIRGMGLGLHVKLLRIFGQVPGAEATAAKGLLA